MEKDAIVEEARERRDQYAAALHHDIDEIYLGDRSGLC
jgi:molybdopterin synthase catalytic subunit